MQKVKDVAKGGVDYSFECAGNLDVLREAFLSSHDVRLWFSSCLRISQSTYIVWTYLNLGNSMRCLKLYSPSYQISHKCNILMSPLLSYLCLPYPDPLLLLQGWGLTVVLGVHPSPSLLPLHPMELFDGRKIVASTFGDFKGKSQLPDFAKQCMDGVSFSLPFKFHVILVRLLWSWYIYTIGYLNSSSFSGG